MVKKTWCDKCEDQISYTTRLEPCRVDECRGSSIKLSNLHRAINGFLDCNFDLCDKCKKKLMDAIAFSLEFAESEEEEEE